MDEVRIGRALSCGQDGRIGTSWSGEDYSQEDGECTGRVWLQFQEAAHAEEAVQEWHGAPYEGRITVVRMGYWLAAEGGVLEEEIYWLQWWQYLGGGSCARWISCVMGVSIGGDVIGSKK